jgi:hypothetical protein
MKWIQGLTLSVEECEGRSLAARLDIVVHARDVVTMARNHVGSPVHRKAAAIPDTASGMPFRVS